MGMNMKKILLGCIADDFTGATDLANNLVRSGMKVVQTVGVPDSPLDAQVDAVVVSLKTRTIPANEAAAQSVQALHWLQAQGAPALPAVFGAIDRVGLLFLDAADRLLLNEFALQCVHRRECVVPGLQRLQLLSDVEQFSNEVFDVGRDGDDQFRRRLAL